MRTFILGSAFLFLAAMAQGSEPNESATQGFKPISMRDNETIVFFGDSITEQNLYTAYIETFLQSRFPNKRIACFNFGWGGDTASGGNARFARDVAPVRPSLVFVNFGMNDGGYKAFEEPVYRSYMQAQKKLADTVAASGAREVLFTTSPIDDTLRGGHSVYNETLSRMAFGVADLARERKLPVIDLLHPMVEIQRRAKEGRPNFTMIPDMIHPDPVGHLVMAYLALKQIDAPRSIGELVIEGGTLKKAEGVTVANVVTNNGGVDFDLTLPFIPFYVPQNARKALDMVPFQEQLNRFHLSIKSPGSNAPMVLTIDGQTAAIFGADEWAGGIDLALLDKAPWAQAGKRLWDVAQYRWTKHQEAWRRMGIEKPDIMMPGLSTFEPFARAQRAYVDDLGRSMGLLAKPKTYHVSLCPQGETVTIGSVELSPSYPLEGFDTVYPAEKDPASTVWRKAPLVDGRINLGKHYNNPTNAVAYARVLLEADHACTLHLAMGSDDGLAVFLDGRRVFAHDVLRGLTPGEDELEVRLAPGKNVLLFKITQDNGGFALAVEAQVRGRGSVKQVVAP